MIINNCKQKCREIDDYWHNIFFLLLSGQFWDTRGFLVGPVHKHALGQLPTWRGRSDGGHVGKKYINYLLVALEEGHVIRESLLEAPLKTVALESNTRPRPRRVGAETRPRPCREGPECRKLLPWLCFKMRPVAQWFARLMVKNEPVVSSPAWWRLWALPLHHLFILTRIGRQPEQPAFSASWWNMGS